MMISLTALEDNQNILYAIMQEFYFDLPPIEDIKFESLLSCTIDLKLFEYGQWLLAYSDNNIIYYELIK